MRAPILRAGFPNENRHHLVAVPRTMRDPLGLKVFRYPDIPSGQKIQKSALYTTSHLICRVLNQVAAECHRQLRRGLVPGQPAIRNPTFTAMGFDESFFSFKSAEVTL